MTPRQDPAALRANAARFLTLGKPDRALETLGRALDIDRGDAEAWLMRSRAHLLLGQKHAAMRDLKNALGASEDPRALSKRVREDPAMQPLCGSPFLVDVFRPDSGLADAKDLLWDEEFKEAAEAFEACLDASPGDAGTLYLLSVARGSLGEHEEALRAAEACIALDPDFPDAHFNRGTELEALGRTEEAVDAYERVLACDPEHVNACFNLVLALRTLGQHERGTERSAQVLALVPDAALLRYKRAESLAMLGRSEEALRELERVVAEDPDAIASIRTNDCFSELLGSPAWKDLFDVDRR